MENKDDKKDYKDLLKWDEDSGREETKEIPAQKRSKKVVKREAKEFEKQRKAGILKERNKSRITKKGKIGIIAGAAIVVIAVAAWTVFAYFGIGLDLTKTLARVDNMKVTAKELNTYMDLVKNQNPESVPPEDDPQYTVLQQDILDQLIFLKLLQSYGDKNGITVTKDEVDSEYIKISQSYPSEADFEKYLKDNKISKDFLSEQIENQILRDKITEKISENISVSEEEMKQYYDENAAIVFTVPDQVKVSHILIKFNVPEGEELTDAIKKEAKDKILDVEKELLADADFAELAKKYSEDTISAENGGDIGLISAGLTVPEFEEAALALDVGEVSPIVETTFGYHLIKVTDKVASYVQTYDEVKETIKTYLLSNKESEAWQALLLSLVKETKITYTTVLKGKLLDVEETTESTPEPAESSSSETTEDAADTVGTADTTSADTQTGGS